MTTIEALLAQLHTDVVLPLTISMLEEAKPR
jgi:hypothetical protein